MERYVADYENLLDLLDEDGVTHRADKSDKSVQIPTKMNELDGVLLIRWQDQDGVIQFIQSLPMEISDEYIKEIERAITILNHAMVIPGFGFNHQYKALYFRMILPLYPRGKVLADEIKAIFRVTVKNAADFLPILCEIAVGKIKGDDVIDEFKKHDAQSNPDGNVN